MFSSVPKFYCEYVMFSSVPKFYCEYVMSSSVQKFTVNMSCLVVYRSFQEIH
jgi:hypothetical protein